jgi:hypothetical protein
MRTSVLPMELVTGSVLRPKEFTTWIDPQARPRTTFADEGKVIKELAG